MAVYSIKAPDGRTIQIQANDEATAIRGAQEWAAENPKADPGNVGAPSSAMTDALADASARSRSLAGEITPRAEQGKPQGPDLAGATAATLGGIVNSIPIVGPLAQTATDAVEGGIAALTGGDYGETVQARQQRRDDIAEANPVANIAGNIVGGVGAYGAAAKILPAALGVSGPLTQRVVNTGLSTLGLGTMDNLARGQGTTEALANAAGPAALASAIPVAGSLLKGGAQAIANQMTNRAQRSLTNTAIEGAPAAMDLKAAGSALFRQMDKSGVAIKAESLMPKFQAMADKALKNLIDPELDAPAYRVLDIIANRTRAAAENGKGLSLGELHNMRQIAQDVAQGAGKGRTGMFAGQMVRDIDEIVKGLKQADVVVDGRAIGNGADIKDVTHALMSGINTWSRAKRVGLIEEAIYKGSNAASGAENGTRNAFRALLKPEARRQFTAAEIQAIEEVANGTGKANMVKLLGKFGFGTNGATNMLGGSIGTALGATAGGLFGPIGSAIGAGIIGTGATGARMLAEKVTTEAAERVGKVVATPNVPVARPVQVPQITNDTLSLMEMLGRGTLVTQN